MEQTGQQLSRQEEINARVNKKAHEELIKMIGNLQYELVVKETIISVLNEQLQVLEQENQALRQQLLNE